LASKKLTLRQKDRIRAAGEAGRAPSLTTTDAGSDAVAAFLDQFEKDQRERTKAQNLRAAQRREERAQALSDRTCLLGRNPDISA
jgi:hypothetical protein